MKCPAEPSRAPLRLVLVANAGTIPSWLFRCVDELVRSGVAEVVGVSEGMPAPNRHPRTVLYRVYARLDRRLFRRRPDALAPVRAPGGVPDPAESADVVLDPDSLLPLDRPVRARYGVWTVRFGSSGDPRTQSAPGYWEVVEGTSETETRLCVRLDGTDRLVPLIVSVAPTDRRSLSRSRNHILWKMAAALENRLRQLWENPQTLERSLTDRAPGGPVPPAPLPGNRDVIRGCTQLVRRYCADTWRDARTRAQWALAYRLGDGPLRTLLPPPDRFWADPFPVRVGDEYYVFYEEAPFSTGKGHLMAAVLDLNGHVLAPGIPVLEASHHLSYPCVFQWDGEFFMIPETGALREVRVYRCARFPGQWTLERTVLSGLQAFDATPALLAGHWWLFANVAGPGAGSTDALHVFHGESPLGPWTPHRANPVKSDVRSARPAGRLFERGGAVYRPAQDCSRHYGYAIAINRVTRLDADAFEESEVDKILPDWAPEVTGVHTLNTAGDLTVIDCLLRRKRPLIRPG